MPIDMIYMILIMGSRGRFFCKGRGEQCFRTGNSLLCLRIWD